MTLIVRRDWRDNVRGTALDQRLALAGCPVSLDLVLDTAGSRNGPLTQWAQTSLGQGWMLRTSQAEHIAAGDSLEETAQVTGVSVEFVLYYLTRFEEDEAVVTEFYNRTTGEA